MTHRPFASPQTHPLLLLHLPSCPVLLVLLHLFSPRPSQSPSSISSFSSSPSSTSSFSSSLLSSYSSSAPPPFLLLLLLPLPLLFLLPLLLLLLHPSLPLSVHPIIIIEKPLISRCKLRSSQVFAVGSWSWNLLPDRGRGRGNSPPPPSSFSDTHGRLWKMSPAVSLREVCHPRAAKVNTRSHCFGVRLLVFQLLLADRLCSEIHQKILQEFGRAELWWRPLDHTSGITQFLRSIRSALHHQTCNSDINRHRLDVFVLSDNL